MRLKKLIKIISLRQDIQASPPVLIDIWASGGVNKIWKNIAHFSKCIAFDADGRNFDISNRWEYKEFLWLHKIVVDKSHNEEKRIFFFTSNPYCSSLLEPEISSLNDYFFSSFFTVNSTEKVEIVELQSLLQKEKITYIDWLKIDTQGTDVRLLESLGTHLIDRVLVIETEPGFINAYQNEDKITDCLNFMKSRHNFFLSKFEVKGVLRIPEIAFNNIFRSRLWRRIASRWLKNIPGWAEITYTNSLIWDEKYSAREYILAWLFVTLEWHHGLAYVYSQQALKRFKDDDFFIILSQYSSKKLKKSFFSCTVFFRLFTYFIKKHFV